MKFRKKQSKRVSTRKRAKIERKVREHTRKIRKDDKLKKGKKKKDPGVPNSYPFKEQVLKEAYDKKLQREAEIDQKKLEKKQRQKQKRETQKLQKVDASEKNAESNVVESSHVFQKEFKKVIDAADIIIEVLDARDPLGSKSDEVEMAVRAANKKLVLLLNKIDLVPKENVEQWLKYFRKQLPCVAFKSSTQKQNQRLGHLKVSWKSLTEKKQETSQCIGASTLMKLLGNYCRNKDIKTSITVGVVGFPNTGKSSVINSLKRGQACNVGATPGVTRYIQKVRLDQHILLVDSPGIVIGSDLTDTQKILRNCVRVESLEDPVTPVEAIVKRCTKQQMMQLYDIPSYSDINELLVLLAKRLGRLKKGGIPNIRHAARKILQDWNFGKIRYYTQPPEIETVEVVSTQIVSSLAKEFDIDALLAAESEDLKDLKPLATDDVMVNMEQLTQEVTHSDDEVEESNEEMDDDVEEEEEVDELPSTVVNTPNTSKKRWKKKSKLKNKVEVKSQVQKLEDKQQYNKAKKVQYKTMLKKRRKDKKKTEIAVESLASTFANL